MQYLVEEAVIDRLRHHRDRAAQLEEATSDAHQKVQDELQRATGGIR